MLRDCDFYQGENLFLDLIRSKFLSQGFVSLRNAWVAWGFGGF